MSAGMPLVRIILTPPQNNFIKKVSVCVETGASTFKVARFGNAGQWRACGSARGCEVGKGGGTTRESERASESEREREREREREKERDTYFIQCRRIPK